MPEARQNNQNISINTWAKHEEPNMNNNPNSPRQNGVMGRWDTPGPDPATVEPERDEAEEMEEPGIHPSAMLGAEAAGGPSCTGPFTD